ncbi:MAG: lysylphosphatidylglycerol synthase transmembrane domain-containing protein [Candidatus Nanohaloarchaea archaeon]|nr:lysylphosphatidylglycerol synthase transmembrane domain-containing protein [Candidatus Nanohaloarchaea archaeon]
MRLGRQLVSWRSLVSAALVAASFYVLSTAVDIRRSVALVLDAELTLFAAAVVLYYVPFLVRGQRWRLLLERAGVDVSLPEASEVTFLSFFVNNVIPAQLGDVYRGHLLGKRLEESRSEVTGTVFVVRVLDFVTLVALVTVLGYFVLAARFWEAFQYLRIGYVFVAAMLVAVAAMLLTRPHRLLPGRLEAVYDRFVAGASASLGRDNLLQVVALTLTVWLFVMVRVFLVSQAAGAGLSFPAAAFLGLFMIMLTIVPFTPAGLGIVEVLTTAVLSLLGVDPAVTLSVVLLDRMITLVSVVITGGSYYLYTGRDVV